MRRFLVLALALLSVRASLADDAAGRFVAILGFSLNASNLSAIQDRLGEAQTFEVPEGHHEFAICYRFAHSNAIIWFSSDGEFGGPEKELLGISMASANSRHWPCAELSIDVDQVTFDGIELGMSKAAFRSVVSEPFEVSDSGELVRAFESESQLTDSEVERIAKDWPGVRDRPVADVQHTVWGRFVDNRLIQFGCWRVETL